MRIELEEEKKEDPRESLLNPETKYKTDLSRKEQRQQEKEKLKGMGLGKKLQYIWMYYKPAIFGVIAAIVLVFVARDMYENAKRETVLSLSVVNSVGFDSDTEAARVKEVLGADGKYDDVVINANLTTDQNGTEFDYYTQMAYVSQLSAKSIDVMIMPETLYKSMRKDGFFANLKEVLGEEEYASFGDSIDEDHLILGEEQAEDYGLFYKPACVVVMVNSERTEAAAKWLSSLAE